MSSFGSYSGASSKAILGTNFIEINSVMHPPGGYDCYQESFLEFRY